MEKMKLSEILKKLEEDDIHITKRTFQFFQKIDLLPKPEKKVGKRGRGVYGYYDYQIVAALLKHIYELKTKGHRLYDIMKRGENNVIERYKSILREWGFSGYSLPEMYGIDQQRHEKIEKEDAEPFLRETIKEFWEKGGRTLTEEMLDFYVKRETFDSIFERQMLEDLRWWYSDKAIEAHALERISNKFRDSIPGLIAAVLEVTKEIQISKDKTADKVLHKIYKKLWITIVKAEVISSKANARLADIIGKDYKSMSKEQWEEDAKEHEKMLKKAERKKGIKNDEK